MLKKFTIKYGFLLLITGILNLACSGNSTVSTNFLPSVGSSLSPSDSSYFYIDLDIDRYESNDQVIPFYEISTTEEFGDSVSRDSVSNCEIEYTGDPEDKDSEKNSTENLICILDIMEYEFLLKDTHIEYNFPKGMCDHVKTALPWHFNYPMQLGPDVDNCTKTATSAEEAGYYDKNKSATCEAGASCCKKEIENLCDDYDGNGAEKIRCCYGGTKAVSGGSSEQWVPDAACFGGPGVVATNFEVDFKSYRTQAVQDQGLRGTITLSRWLADSGIVLRDGVTTSIAYANYLEDLDVPPSQLRTKNRSNLPAFLQKHTLSDAAADDDENDPYPHTPNLFYEFQCLDQAGEVLHKILLMVRDWNTEEEFLEFRLSGGKDDSNPDIEGKEGDECKYDDRSILDQEEEQCNDLLDLKDFDSCNTSLYPKWCKWINRGTQDGYPGISYP